MGKKSIFDTVQTSTSSCKDQLKKTHVDDLNNVQDERKKNSIYDARAVYEKGSATSNSYKTRLNAVLQNEGRYIRPTSTHPNNEFQNSNDGKDENNDLNEVQKITIEDNPYYG